MMNDLKLDIGAGRHRIPGFIPIDRKLGHEAAELPLTVRRWHDDGLESEDILLDHGSVSEVRASHVLEHLSFADAEKALREWATILQPGGRMRVAVPDFDKISNGACANDPKRLRYLMGGQTDEDDFHRSAWTRESLTAALNRAGLTVTGEWKSELQDCASLPVSLNLEAVKGEADTATLDLTGIKLAAITSIPRLGFNDHWGCIHDALVPMGIPVWSVSGAFWGHCLQNGFELAVERGVDWILALDYDTMFTRSHVERLLYEFYENKSIGALAALQPRRRTGEPLIRISDTATVKADGTPFEVDSAHFGLTLIRVEALKRTPKPWFFGKPNEDGSWGDGKIDDDIWFWRRFREAGNKLYSSSWVRVGHIEMVCAHYDDGAVDVGPEFRRYSSPREWIDSQKGKQNNDD